MKNLIKNTIVLMLLVASGTSVVAKELPVSVRVAGEKSIELFLGEMESKVWISFKDDEGNVFYSKKIKDLTAYRVTYDLAAFPDGEYTLELSAPRQIINVPVTIHAGLVALKEEIASAPVVSEKGNVVAVELSGKTNNAWDVLIKNTEGELIFRETVTGGKTAKRKYDLSNLNKGEYTLQFNTAGSMFSHTAIVKN